ncbi:hypothetical protein L7F22_063147 [Adiantum nelumboides]|nr:hypothetical protein [Adiantum nelumboides]
MSLWLSNAQLQARWLVRGLWQYSFNLSQTVRFITFGLLALLNQFEMGPMQGGGSNHWMGGCKQNPDACSSDSCEGHAVDLMHFSIGGAIPGRLYGANAYDNANSTGKDSIGSLHDMYGWNPHCRYFDGLLPNESSIPNSGSQNDWRGAWSHSSMDLTYDGWIVAE